MFRRIGADVDVVLAKEKLMRECDYACCMSAAVVNSDEACQRASIVVICQAERPDRVAYYPCPTLQPEYGLVGCSSRVISSLRT